MVIVISDDEDGGPPPSQSHFAKFEDFKPDDAAPFDQEFSRLASSQEWVPGSQEYTRQRTIAMREELQLHYFSQPPPKLEVVDEEDEKAEPASAQEIALRGYQELCREVGLDEEAAGGNVDECKKALKSTLVNIVDLIDARRTHAKVEVWTDFEKFRAYTLQDGKRIDPKEARASPGYLASLLQRLGGPRRKKGKKRKRGGVVSGRVTKSEA
ncbi:hypothetical protein GGTG_10411 [Gaeumannomyces tritici R3-111a-1]|uniref:Uncharacterized protein n=1 Tax=Gaeumannomyces tritici (strain R3-111a-1) TaxID=644352 RepID=J3PA85_GAET3|nr:hypothetical protein GGTG_10411 [Gaeumannomyces tritici R3-111a-1]EJT71151.1 hypothetical protein GGTG_10411 [Gaeumannomyces tritici R3-111a-1]